MREFSEETASAVDREVHKLLQEAYNEAKELLVKYRPALDAIAEALCEKETIEAAELDELIAKAVGADVLPPRPPVKEKVEIRPAASAEEQKGGESAEPAVPGALSPRPPIPGTV
jgi:hypothetical protein